MDKTLQKAAIQKFVELREHFLGAAEPTKVIESSLKRLAKAEIDLQRLEDATEKINPTDAANAFIFIQRDRADRKFRTRLAAVQKLLSQRSSSQTLADSWEIHSCFGHYTIHGEPYLHWRYIQSKPLSYGFHEKPPAQSKTINGEVFVPVSVLPKLRNNIKGESSINRANEIERTVHYKPLERSKWLPQFKDLSASKDRLQFDDELPEPGVCEKSIRNAVDYRNRIRRAEMVPK